MSAGSLPPYQDCQALCSQLSLEPTCSELHGLLCGLLANQIGLTAQGWLAVITQKATVTPCASDCELLSNLFTRSKEQMEAASPSDLALMLPPEDQPLQDRVQACANWCHGFILGFAEGGGFNESRLSPLQHEALGDISAISQLQDQSLEQTASPDDFQLIIDHLRLAVLSLVQDSS